MQPSRMALISCGEHPLQCHTRVLLSHMQNNDWVILTPYLDRYIEQMDHLNTDTDYVDFEFLCSSHDIPGRIPAAAVYGFRPMLLEL